MDQLRDGRAALGSGVKVLEKMFKVGELFIHIFSFCCYLVIVYFLKNPKRRAIIEGNRNLGRPEI